MAEQHDEWAVARRYMSAESLGRVLMPRQEQPKLEEEATKELDQAA